MGGTDRKNSRILIALLLAALLLFASMGTVLAEGAEVVATATSVETATPTDVSTPTQTDEPQPEPAATPTELPEAAPSQESMETLFPELVGLTPGVDYVADEVVYVGDSYREAREVTQELAPLEAEIDSYKQGVAVIKVDFDAYNEAADAANEAVAEAVSQGESPAEALASDTVVPIEEVKDAAPDIAPNYIFTLAETTDYLSAVELAAATDVAGVTVSAYYNNQYWYAGANSMNVPQAQAITGELDTINVAVLDSGVDVDHPDLIDRCVQTQYNVKANTGADDNHGHGTHVAGIIAGVSENAEIISIKVVDDAGSGDYATLAAGVRQAITLSETIYPNLKVINMSLAFTSPGSVSQIAEVVTEAAEAGILCVCAAGNNNSSSQYSPACETYALSVGATNSSGTRGTSWGLGQGSNYGDWVDMVAPGERIYSTYPVAKGSYASLTGTSMAAPMVAGEAAILYGIDAELKQDKTETSVTGATSMLRTYSRTGTVAGFANAKIADAYELVLAYTAPSIGVRLSNAAADYTDYAKLPSGDNDVTVYANTNVDVRYTVNGNMPAAYTDGTAYSSAITLSAASKQTQTLRVATFDGATHNLLATATSVYTVLPESTTPLTAASQHLAQPEYTGTPMDITGGSAGATWYSTRPTVVIVNDTGGVTLRNAISQKYTATVYAFGANSYQKIDITAYPNAATGVAIDQSDIIMSIGAGDALGNKRQLAATVSGTGTINSGYCGLVKWSSGTPGVATVDDAGLVTGVSPGASVIRAAAVDGSGLSASLTVRVIASSGVSGGYAVTVDLPEGYSGSEVWVDGVAATATNLGSATNNSADAGRLVVPVSGTGKTNVVMYEYRADGVPIGMYVWMLDYSSAAGSYIATEQPAMQDLLAYAGFSIRVTGNAGIRCKTGIVPATRTALLSSAGIDGYRLSEYGTVVMLGSRYDEGYDCVKGGAKASIGQAYYTENGQVKDFVFETKAGRYRYTSVLTNIAAANYDAYYNFRGYITLTKDGQEITLYGPMVSRSIYYIARQIMSAGEFAVGTSAYNFVQNIINTVDASAGN